MTKSSNGVLRMAGGPATKKFPSGMRFFENVAGGMMRVRSLLNRSRERVSATGPTSKPGWTCMMQRKEESQLSPKAETHHLHNWQDPEQLSPSVSSDEIAIN